MGNRRAPRGVKNAHPKRFLMGVGLGWPCIGLSVSIMKDGGGRASPDLRKHARRFRSQCCPRGAPLRERGLERAGRGPCFMHVALFSI